MLLKINNLHKCFPGVENSAPVEVLKGLELQVEEGETTAIIGQSGSGKSTLLSLLAGLDIPTSGTLILKERRLDSMTEEELTRFRAENIGIVFQQFRCRHNHSGRAKSALKPMVVLESLLDHVQ